MAERKEKHIHKLKRLKYKSGNVIFFCSLPDCSFKTNISLALGKRSICWRCGNSFIISEYSLRLAKPHCDACHKPKNDSIERNPDGSVIVPLERYNEVPVGFNPVETTHTLTLAERLQQTRKQAKQRTKNEEEI